VIQRNHQGLRLAAKACDEAHAQQTTPRTEAMPSPPLPRPLAPPSMELSPTLRSPAEQRRLARYQEVLALASRGLGPKALAQRVGPTRQTVALWLRAGSVPERPPSRPRRMRITPYAPYLRERWHAGAQHSRPLWREIQAKGFTGGSETVRRLTVQWYPARGRSGPPKRQSGKPTPRPAPPNCGDTPALTATRFGGSC